MEEKVFCACSAQSLVKPRSGLWVRIVWPYWDSSSHATLPLPRFQNGNG